MTSCPNRKKIISNRRNARFWRKNYKSMRVWRNVLTKFVTFLKESNMNYFQRSHLVVGHHRPQKCSMCYRHLKMNLERLRNQIRSWKKLTLNSKSKLRHSNTLINMRATCTSHPKNIIICKDHQGCVHVKGHQQSRKAVQLHLRALDLRQALFRIRWRHRI